MVSLERSAARVAGEGAVTVAIYALTIFTSAALLFSVEPLFAKLALPLLGGSPDVWNTSVVFFQLALLAGYLYAHAVRTWLRLRWQIALHLGVMLLAVIVLPIQIAAGWHAPANGTPVVALLGLLTVSVGLPFFVLSSSSPLLQWWFGCSGHRSARDPYFLYAASNVGSILGLLAYPFAVEPFVGARQQSWVWAVGYLALVLAVAACGALVWHRPHVETDVNSGTDVRASAERMTTRQRWRWTALAAVPSSLMLATTTHLSTTIAPIPLMWVLPLALYLTTFIIAFGWYPQSLRAIVIRIVPYAVLPIAILTALDLTVPTPAYVALHLFALFVLALVAHGTLAAERPGPRRLTEYYLWISIGGAVGGMFNALLAPLLFPHVEEFPITLVIGALLLPLAASSAFAAPRREWKLDFALPAACGIALWCVTAYLPIAQAPVHRQLAFAGAAVVCFAFFERRLRFALGLVALFIVGSLLPNSNGRELSHERNFFGIKRVFAHPSGHYRLFVHSGIIHGIQSTVAGRETEPLSYYTRGGPLGQVFALTAARGPVAAVGLGVGTVACYRSPDQAFTFFEIDPAVERIARAPEAFSYLQRCAPAAAVVVGDGRLTLNRTPAHHFGLIILDAYSADTPPLHLLTREALQVYLGRLAPGGVLAFHISNRNFDLRPAVGNLAKDAGLAAFVRDDTQVAAREEARGRQPSTWVVMARNEYDLNRLTADRRWKPLRAEPRLPLWTDDYSSLIRLWVL